MLGPALEAALKPHGLTLRHFPQSFEFSTVGGWIATRSGGHFATLYTHIDDFVESLRVVTPAGVLESRRLPGLRRRAEPRPAADRLRGRARRDHRGLAAPAGPADASAPARRSRSTISWPARGPCARSRRPGSIRPTCAWSTPTSVSRTASTTAAFALLVLAFESADHPVDAWQARALELVQDHGGRLLAGRPRRRGLAHRLHPHAVRARGAGAGRRSIGDTFETAITWDRFEAFHAQVKAATEQAIREATGRPGLVTCRFTHVYPDGPAPYFTFHAPGRAGRAARAVAADQAARPRMR